MRVLSGLALDRATHKKSQPARGRTQTRAPHTCLGPADAKSLSGTRAPLGHQNQPPEGMRPLRCRYVTRLP